jgi:hypothetical protein
MPKRGPATAAFAGYAGRAMTNARPATLPRRRSSQDGLAVRLGWAAALLFLGLLGATAIASLADPRSLGGVGVWVKPMKFNAALALHAATLAIAASLLSAPWREGAVVRWAVILAIGCSVAEVAYITVQAGLGQASHFNVGTPFHAAMYTAMAVGAVVLTAAAGVLGLVAALDRAAPIGAGLRLGLVLGLAGGAVLTIVIAFAMGGRLTHHVGVPVTGARLPLLGWSREVGDLRAPHFLATHMMQVIPIAGWLADRAFPAPAARVATALAAAAWAALAWWQFGQALAGRPIF